MNFISSIYKAFGMLAFCVSAACTPIGPSIPTPDVTQEQGVTFAQPPIAAIPDLPTYMVTSRSFKKRGEPVSLRSAMLNSLTAGQGLFSAAPAKVERTGPYLIGLRHVRYDTYDLLVAQLWGADSFGDIVKSSAWINAAAPLARAATQCDITKEFLVQDPNRGVGRVFVLDC